MLFGSWGVMEVSRRFVTLVLLCAGVIAAFGYGRLDAAAACGGAAIAAYLLPPRPKPPEGAFHHDRLPSVWMPDLLGFLLATTFLAMPFIVSALEEWPGVPWGLMLFMWPPGLVALAIFWFSARYQCFWVLPERSSITIGTLRGKTVLTYSEIVRVTTETRRPPGWLSPLLILFGGWRGLGIALLHGTRPNHSLVLERKDGEPVRLPLDAFPDAAKVVKALERAGVPTIREPANSGRRNEQRKPERSGDDAELA
ncbi:MAG: hypothetical protein F9K19_14490 [Rhizobiaceae bacterium]|nr:MAG: hypothetical protein F9K19_14490 [Rhizobiaceae bacterium]CAG1014840.1 hypothetical protein RHIZO_04897 [Rhizobiaceae bacterium]